MLVSRTKSPRRLGAAAVEFALVAPLLFTLIFAAIDCGRAMMGLDLVANAARDGCRTGALSNGTNTSVISAANAQMNAAGLTGATPTVTITVNGNSVDCSTANQGDQIMVTVSVPANSVSWLPTSWYFGGTTLTRSVVMRRE